MKKALVAALCVMAVALSFLFSRRAPPAVSNPPPARVEPGPAPAPGRPEIAAPLPEDRGALQALAAEWRREARGRAEFRDRLRRLVLDEAAPAATREAAALVLGTLPDRDGLGALAQALNAARDPRWIRTLLLALGCERTSGEDDDIFGLPDSPRVCETPLGLAVRIRGALDDPDLRNGITPWMGKSGDAGVRWAAALALADSASFSDVRDAYLAALPGERDPATEGEISKALSDWAATADSGERAPFITVLLDGAARPEAASLRLRSEDGLKRMTWTRAEVGLFLSRMEAGTLDQRRWAIAVLAGAGVRSDIPDRERVFESLARAAGAESDAKLREFAVTGLSGWPGAERVFIAALGDAAWHVRAAAVRAMGRGPGSREVKSALERAEQADADERVRRAAAEVRRAMSAK